MNEEVKFIQNSDKPIPANEGYLNMKWKGTPPYTLIFAKTPGFENAKPLYSGKDSGYFISGLEQGDHYFKVTDDKGFSDTLSVSVNYPSTNLVIGSLILGSILFLSLCSIIIIGNKKYE